MGYRHDTVNRIAIQASELNLIIQALVHLNMDRSSRVNFEKSEWDYGEGRMGHFWSADFYTSETDERIAEFLKNVSEVGEDIQAFHYQTDTGVDPAFGISGWSIVNDSFEHKRVVDTKADSFYEHKGPVDTKGMSVLDQLRALAKAKAAEQNNGASAS